MLRRFFSLLFTLLIALALPAGALAQSYSFSLDEQVAHAYWNQDGTLTIDYIFVFTNAPGAHAIDFVDVGLPNGTFNFDDISADVDGRRAQISTDYQGQGTGVAVDLGANAIQPGKTGSVHVRIPQVRNVLYTDSQDERYASAKFSPTWFGSQYVNGSTDLTVVYHLPPGVKSQEPRWHAAPSGFPSEPQTGFDNEGRVTYTWAYSNASGSTQYIFGASFPKTYVPDGAITSIPAFDFGGFTSALLGSLCPILCVGFIALLVFGLPIISARQRKLKYLPPRISIEGHGIKRGLTAVEAAILMETPLDKVMTMILFGALKKEAVSVISRDPLELKLAEPLPGELRDYERAFLKAFDLEDVKARQKALEQVFVKFVRSVAEKMRGFSRKETVTYYKAIMEKAWQQVEAADTPEVRSRLIDENLEWTMLDRDYEGRTRRVITGPIFAPRWWGHYDPVFARPVSTPGTASGSSPVSSPPRLPGSDFAASIANGVQGFSQKVIGDVASFTGRVTKFTNPPPPPSRSGYSGRGGGGCACACACAGCACACAGGGR
jgi:hypothetical protein